MPKISFRKPSSEFGVCTAIRVKFLPVWFTVRSEGLQSIGREAWTGEKSGKRRFAIEFTFVDSFDRSLEKDERKKALLHAIERLPPEQKEVITLKIWSELTFDEIARTLDLSLNTVASRYRYALDKLKEWVPVSLEKGPSEKSSES